MSWIVEVAYDNQARGFKRHHYCGWGLETSDLYGPFNMASSAQHFSDRLGKAVQHELSRGLFTIVVVRELNQPKILTARARIQAFLGDES